MICDLDDATEGIPRRWVFHVSDAGVILPIPNKNLNSVVDKNSLFWSSVKVVRLCCVKETNAEFFVLIKQFNLVTLSELIEAIFIFCPHISVLLSPIRWQRLDYNECARATVFSAIHFFSTSDLVFLPC